MSRPHARSTILGLAGILLLGAVGMVNAQEQETPGFAGRLTFASPLTGDQVIPPVDTTATGNTIAVLVDDLLVVTGHYQDLSGDLLINPLRGLQVFEGNAGEQGSTLRLTAEQAVPGLTNFQLTHDTTGPTSGTFSGAFTLTPEQIEDLMAGRYFVQIHTRTNRNGELRGQLLPTTKVDLSTEDLFGYWEDITGGEVLLLREDGTWTIVPASGGTVADTLASIGDSVVGEFALDGSVVTLTCPDWPDGIFHVEVSGEDVLRTLMLDREKSNCDGPLGWRTWRRIVVE